MTLTLPHAEWAALALMEKFRAYVQVYPSSSYPASLESVWNYGHISVRYRLHYVTQKVEVLSVALDQTSVTQ